MKRKILIIGYGVSGRSAASFLLQRGESVIAADKKAIQAEVPLFLDSADLPLDDVKQVILSPGVPPTHPLVVKAKEAGIEVIGEIELAFRHLTNRCIGITGTNGKTTTCFLVAHILNGAGKKAKALGNVGTSLSSYLLDPHPEDILVVELSSFQLESMRENCLDAAAVLNITPDHLDRYGSMEEYAKVKLSIFDRLKPGGEAWISEQIQSEFAHLVGKDVKIFDSDTVHPLAPISPIRYIQLGVPERQNIQAALSLCRKFGISDGEFYRGLETFRKPAHRIEYVGEWNGISFYNDSKATNIDSVMHAVGLFEGPIVLIAGGVDKGASYQPWIESFGKKVKKIVAYGQASAKMEGELKGAFSFQRVETLQEAVVSAAASSNNGDTVMLSPGCSSYDQFKSYEHRGNEFRRFIEEKVWIEKKRS